MKDIVYDIETYRAVFSIVMKDRAGELPTIVGEVSCRRNDWPLINEWIWWYKANDYRMVGFNNEGFDWPVVDALLNIGDANHHDIVLAAYTKAQAIIQGGDRFGHVIWPSDQIVPQVDLFKIMHFDNVARSTSLKKLQLAMGSPNVVDTPHDIHSDTLTDAQLDDIIRYNINDVDETCRFADEIQDRIDFRDQLGPDHINYNDTKIGKQRFIREIEAAGVPCFTRVDGRRKPIQTPRHEGIEIGRKLVEIPFGSPDLIRVAEHFRHLRLMPHETKGVFDDLHAMIGTIRLDFGTGGLHGSLHSETVRADDKHDLVDLDVTSYYPSLAIVNGFYPEHLGPTFVRVYRDLKAERVNHPKGSTENAALKLALNGTYGDSNNPYSPFYDPAYTMAITINGQLMLAWLAEMLVAVGAQLVQVNTDGLTILVDKRIRRFVDHVVVYWQRKTMLDLEDVSYAAMFIRDVNNYIALTVDGKVKRKGAYDHDRDWHQDHSALVIQRAVEARLVNNYDIDTFLHRHGVAKAFMVHVKAPRAHRLELGGAPVQNVSRFFVANDGAELIKIMPPLKGKTDDRRNAQYKGWRLVDCNDMADFDWSRLQRFYYAQEARKLVTAVGL